MITKLNLDTLTNQGYDYIMGVKLRQDAWFQMLFESDQLDWERATNDKQNQLKLLERTVSVKEFWLWKTKQILVANQLTNNEETWQQFTDQIVRLTDE